MKKMVLVLAVLLFAVPAMATVTITCTADGNEVSVWYDATSESELVRAFALDIIASDDANIVKMDSFDPNYPIYPGSIVISSGSVTNSGSPICDGNYPGDGYPGTKGGLDTNGVTIEMGSLYVGEANEPDANGLLCKLYVDASCTVTIKENTIRSGVVMEDVTDPATNLSSSCEATVGATCDACSFDLNSDTYLGPEDVSALIVLLNKYSDNWYYISPGDDDYDVCLDANGDTYIGPEDLSKLIVELNKHSDNWYYVLCAGLDFP